MEIRNTPLLADSRDELRAVAATTLSRLLDWGQKMRLTGNVRVTVHMQAGEPRTVQQSHEGHCN